MDKEVARDIRHAIAASMAEYRAIWTPLHDYAAGQALAGVSLPNETKQEQAQLEETQAVKYAHTRLTVMVRDDWLNTDDRNLLLDDIRILCNAYDTARAATRDANASLVAERRARELAQRVCHACFMYRDALPMAVRAALEAWEKGQ